MWDRTLERKSNFTIDVSHILFKVSQLGFGKDSYTFKRVCYGVYRTTTYTT